MDYSKQIFTMLNIKPDEEFKLQGLSDKNIYSISNALYVHEKNEYQKTNHYVDGMLTPILNGTYTIIKLPKKIIPTKEEQIVIDYAKLCGYKYLAKDYDGAIFAFGKKPYKCQHTWSDNTCNYLKLYSPISFISWEDDEPYEI